VNLGTVAVKNVLRNRFRAALTVAGVAVAIITFMILRTLVYAWTSGADYAARDRVVTRNKITFVMPLPKRYLDQVRAAQHVKLATCADWFGAKDPKHDREFFGQFAVDRDTYFLVYDDMAVPPDQLAAWKADKQGAIIGDVLAKKMGWKIGDKVILSSGIYPREGDWEFHIDGIYEAKAKSVDRSSFIFDRKLLADEPSLAGRVDGNVGWITSRVDDPKAAADVGVALDKVFDDQEIQTLSQDEHAFNASFLASISAVLTAVDIISVVILIIMMLILGNTIAMGVRERTNEYGVLKALGFSGGHIAGFIVGESIVISVIGGVLGLALSYPFIQNVLGRYLEENMGTFFPYFNIDPRTTVMALGLAVLLGGIAAAWPAYRASQLKVVDALRRVA
jgi:putative ABC transport system permease protein